MIKIYIAAPFELRPDAISLAAALEVHGIGCTSRWLTAPEALTAQWALWDLADVASADVCVVLNPDAWKSAGTGGRHVELGYALALRKPIVLVGARTNIFHHLADHVSGPDVQDVLAAVQQVAQRWKIQ